MKKAVLAVSSVLAFTFVFAMAASAAECCKADNKACAMNEKGTCPPSKSAASSKEPTEQDVVIDPVCGMDVKVSDSKYSYTYKGKTYHFCSKSCMNSFKKDPSKFIGKERK